MKIISLSSIIAGPACSIACSIKKHFYPEPNSYPTGIFDYLEISLKSILQILEIDNFSEKISTNNYIYLNNDNKFSIQLNNFDHLISHHDLNKNNNKESIDLFFEKYNRRYKRLLNDLMIQDKIFFIRYGEEDINTIQSFFNIIKKINPTLEIFFINIVLNEENNITEIFDKNFTLINFNNYIDKNKIYSDNLFFKIMEFDWKIVYTIIETNLNEIEKKNFIYF